MNKIDSAALRRCPWGEELKQRSEGEEPLEQEQNGARQSIPVDVGNGNKSELLTGFSRATQQRFQNIQSDNKFDDSELEPDDSTTKPSSPSYSCAARRFSVVFFRSELCLPCHSRHQLVDGSVFT